MSSIFNRIINREIPAAIVAENEHYIAFLDVNPLKVGHTLVVPKQEIDYIFDLDNNTLSGLMLFAKGVAHAIQKAIPCNRIGVTVVGLEVPHAHVHLIPMNVMNDMNFANPKLKVSKDELDKVAEDIRKFL